MTGLATTPCRALLGGFGRPGMRDLDFGRQVTEYLQQLDWPDGVVVEDLSCAAPLVLHRLQELRPAKVVLLGAVARGFDPPATVRRYRLDLTPPDPSDVVRNIEESAMGLVDIDHTLAMARQWGGLPVDTTVIEVEPAEASFGLGFSEELAGCFDPILDMVREEVAEVADGAPLLPDLTADEISTTTPVEPEAPCPERGTAEPDEAMADLIGYARDHAQARLRCPPAPAADVTSLEGSGVALAGRVRPWGVFVHTGASWFDAVPLDGGGVGIAVGKVDGRGVEAAAPMSDLRAAVRAYAVLDGASPAQLVDHLDRLAEVTGLGRRARLVYLALRPATGEVRFASAGGCPPFVVGDGAADGRFVDSAGAAPLGAPPAGARPEGRLQLAPGSTLLLFTAGLVESRAMARARGLELLRRAAVEGPHELEDLCDHVLAVCTAELRRDDDICLLGLRLAADAVGAHPRPPQRADGYR